MSTFATPEGEQEGGPQEVAARPSGLRPFGAVSDAARRDGDGKERSDAQCVSAAEAVRSSARPHVTGPLTLGPALIQRTLNAIEAEVRRAAYLSMVAEAFATTDEPSPNLSFLGGSSVFAPIALSSQMASVDFPATEAPAMGMRPVGWGGTQTAGAYSASDGSAVRASARVEAGDPESRPDSGSCPNCIRWDEIREELYGEVQ